MFTNAFKYSAIGMALVSTEGKWIEVNDALCHMTGYSREELLGLKFQDITHPDDLSIDLRLVSQMLNREIESYNLEKRYITKNRKIVWILLTVSLIWSGDIPDFFVSQIVDITTQKELSDTLSQKNAQLEATRDTLVAKVEQLKELHYMIAHNLRGPVNNFKLLSDALLAKEKGETGGLADNFTVKEMAALLSEASGALVNSLNTLMELANVNISKDIRHEQCSIEHVFGEIRSQLSSLIFEKNAVIITSFAIKHITCPRAYLESILYNLLSNALKYSSLGSQPEITISTLQKDAMTLLSVKDNGIGIDLKKYGDQIFKFSKVFHAGYDSKGMGLFLVKSQVEAVGGTISVESEVNKGTEFIVSFGK